MDVKILNGKTMKNKTILTIIALLLLGGCTNYNCTNPDWRTSTEYCSGYGKGMADAKAQPTAVHGGER